MKKLSFYLLLPMFAMAIFACKNDDDSCEATYSNEVKAILDNSCAYSGCHSGSSASAFVPQSSKDYTAYEGLLENLNSGKFTERVLELKNMPPAANFIPAGRPTELTAAELEIINCWVKRNYPKD